MWAKIVKFNGLCSRSIKWGKMWCYSTFEIFTTAPDKGRKISKAIFLDFSSSKFCLPVSVPASKTPKKAHFSLLGQRQN